jgi:predicted PurR-regulated permease PerM
VEQRRTVYLDLWLFAATAATLWAFGLVLWPFLVPIAWAMCLATVSGRWYRSIASRWGRPRLAAVAVTAVVALLVIAPLAVLGTAMAREAVAVKGWLDESESGGGGREPGKPGAKPAAGAPGGAKEDDWDRFFQSHPGLDSIRAGIDKQLASFDTDTRSVTETAMKQLGQPFVSGALGVLQGLFAVVFGFLIMLVTLYVLLRDGDAIRQVVVDVLPLREDDTKHILETLRSTAFAAIVGGLLTSAVQGLIGGIAFWALGLPAPILWGFVMAVLSLFPFGGTALVWAPVGVYLIATDQTGKGIFLLAFGTLVLSTVDNLLRPVFMRRAGASDIHPLLLFFAVISGIGIFGTSGIVFGPLLTAFVLSVIKVYRDHFGKRATRSQGAVPGAGEAPSG